MDVRRKGRMKMKIKRMDVRRRTRISIKRGNEQAEKILIVAGKGYRISNRNETTVFIILPLPPVKPCVRASSSLI